MNTQTNSNPSARLTGIESIKDSYKLLAQNYTVAVVQRQIFGQSNIGATIVNRQAVGYDKNDSTLTTTAFNRVVALDYNLLSADGRWEGDFYFHHSIDPKKKVDPISGGAFLRYNTTKFTIGGVSALVGEGYNAEVGFIQRKDIVRANIFAEYRMYPKVGGLINNHGPEGRYGYFWNFQLDRTDLEYEMSYQVDFNNTAEARFEHGHTYQLLRNDFQPIENYVLPQGRSYDWKTYRINFNTDQRKLIWFDADILIGGFYNGQLQRYQGSINYRFQPFLNIALEFDHGRIDLPNQRVNDDTTISGRSNIWLISPRADITFTDKLFLTTFLQYNERDDNVNLNARLQWRFKPVSDLFLVYTDNYFPDSFASKSRALVFKLTYWLNL